LPSREPEGLHQCGAAGQQHPAARTHADRAVAAVIQRRLPRRAGQHERHPGEDEDDVGAGSANVSSRKPPGVPSANASS
jgi:hypothetical protein